MNTYTFRIVRVPYSSLPDQNDQQGLQEGGGLQKTSCDSITTWADFPAIPFCLYLARPHRIPKAKRTGSTPGFFSSRQGRLGYPLRPPLSRQQGSGLDS